ncbi:efflux transporter outer membrane subunit [Cupriavidus sp. IDO]|uniref:efflux transporter outer membrane subunit n=1 Tax=Cupriavidus sp. IDO TaxID=1539142 RepID=UPI000AB9C144|nr:efflux transporter outer membrane subunit [Cupriavidus sp. IDO]
MLTLPATVLYRLLALSFTAALLASCANPRSRQLLAVEFPAPGTRSAVANAPTLAASSAAASAAAQGPTAPDWWHAFHDPALDRLIADALIVNNDLAKAAIRVYRAQLQAGIAATDLTPNVAANGSIRPRRQAEHLRAVSSLHLSLNYELDLWGSLAAQRDAARWTAEATQAEREGMRLKIIGDTATLYWQIGYRNDQLAFNNANIADAERTLVLVRARHAAGAVSRIDVLKAEQTLISLRAAHTETIQQRTEDRNALSILFNRPPDVLTAEPKTLPVLPLPVVPAYMPADMLSRRPDVREAESRLRASLANIDQKRTSFYPTFTLTGSTGGSNISLTRLLSNPLASIGLEIALPFLQWNKMQLEIKVSKTEYEEAVIKFRETLYGALVEVDNALAKREQLERQAEELTQSLALARHAEALARARYLSGFTDLQPWLDQKRQLRDALNADATNRLAQLENRMTLYQSLGGGDSQDGPQG